jgi:hypothetical protein
MKEIVAQQGTGAVRAFESINRISAPDGMHNSKTINVQPQRQGTKPVDDVAPRIGIISVLIEKGPVLTRVFAIPLPQKAVTNLSRRRERHRVELMIAHYGQRGPLFDHGANDLQCFSLSRPPIDKVAQKDNLPFCMLVDAVPTGIAELLEERLESVSATVNVTNQVMAHALYLAQLVFKTNKTRMESLLIRGTP